MRILPVLLLLPVLVSSGSSAIATENHPGSPQPAIAPPLTAPLTIASLAGTYKVAISEQLLAEQLALVEPLYTREGGTVDEETKKRLEASFRQTYEMSQLRINADSTFDLLPMQLRGRVKLEGNELIFTYDLAQLTTGKQGTAALPRPASMVLVVSADRKTLLYYDPQQPSLPPGVYVKQ